MQETMVILSSKFMRAVHKLLELSEGLENLFAFARVLDGLCGYRKKQHENNKYKKLYPHILNPVTIKP